MPLPDLRVLPMILMPDAIAAFEAVIDACGQKGAEGFRDIIQLVIARLDQSVVLWERVARIEGTKGELAVPRVADAMQHVRRSRFLKKKFEGIREDIDRERWLCD